MQNKLNAFIKGVKEKTKTIAPVVAFFADKGVFSRKKKTITKKGLELKMKEFNLSKPASDYIYRNLLLSESNNFFRLNPVYDIAVVEAVENHVAHNKPMLDLQPHMVRGSGDSAKIMYATELDAFVRAYKIDKKDLLNRYALLRVIINYNSKHYNTRWCFPLWAVRLDHILGSALDG